MATFLSKYRNFGIKLPDMPLIKFQDFSYTTSDPAKIKALTSAPSFGRDFNTVDPLPDSTAPEVTPKEKKK